MNEKSKIILTKAEREALEAEYRHLIDVEQPDVIEKLQLARSQGDLSENSDYDAARDRQAQIESRIVAIEAILNNAVMAEAQETGTGNKIAIGNIVDYEKEDGKKVQVRISGNVGANPTTVPPTVSNESPIGKALLGQKVGAKVRVEAVTPYTITILNVSK